MHGQDTIVVVCVFMYVCVFNNNDDVGGREQ